MKKYYGKLCCKMVFIIILLSRSNLIFPQETEGGLPPNSGQTVPSLNFKDADIRDVLRSIAFDYKTNIVIDNSINSKISVTLFGVTVFSAIKTIAEDNGFEFSYDSLRFFVRTKPVVTPPKPVLPAPQISYTDGKLSISLNNVDIHTLVDSLRSKTSRNFLIAPGTSGVITGTLTDVDLQKGLNDLLRNNGYDLNIKDSIYYISMSPYFSALDSNKAKQRDSYWVSARNGKVTINVIQASLNSIIEDLSNQLNLQVVNLSAPDVKVTLKCNDVSINTAFDYLFKGSDYSYKIDNGAYIIGKKTSKDLENTKLVMLKYLRADKLKDQLPPDITKSVNVSVSIEHNALILSGDNDDLENAEQYIKTIDKPVPEVLIEALVVDYNLDNTLQLGLSAGAGDSSAAAQPDTWYPGFNVTASGAKINQLLNSIGSMNVFGHDIDIAKFGKLPASFYVNLKALEEDGIANVKSRPILSTLNGYTASLKIGTVQNYVFNDIMPITSATSTTYIQKESIQQISANISFEITPWVGPNDELTLEIKPDFETPVGTFSPDKDLIPAINTRSLSSTVRLKNGETIVLGGLIQDSENNTVDKIPFLGDLPIIGALFRTIDKKKTKSELLIYITPTITYDDDFGSTYYNYGN
jgi:type IV pilus assembly protein PilQ